MADNIFPFGKYKGQPIELVLQDTKYKEWLTSQDWFKVKFETTYNTIINYQEKDSDTPEHNDLQNNFLDETFCANFVKKLKNIEVGEIDAIRFERRGWDVFMDVRKYTYNEDSDKVRKYLTYGSIAIECKPTLGDDYPSVLRQMHKNELIANSLHVYPHIVLIVGNFLSRVTSREQLCKIFSSSRYEVIFIEDVK